MLLEVGAPPPDIGYAETEPQFSTSRWLATWGKTGLGLLAVCFRDEGDLSLARWWADRAHRLVLAEPFAGLQLALDVAIGLEDLAKRYEKAGESERAERWRTLAQRVKDRAWERERQRLGMPC